MITNIAEQRKMVFPFPGLRSFSQSESELFFGREGQCDDLAGKLGTSRFTAVVGTSGSGKSSLVRAGLLPSLESGYLAKAGSNWRIVDMRPGSHPIDNLAEALNTAKLSETSIDRGRLLNSSLALVELVRSEYGGNRLDLDEDLLILVDQFEELFRFKARETSMADRDEQAAFVKLLLQATSQRELPIYVVITMRSDFLGDCARFRDLPEAINSGQYLIPRMSRDERREAIEGPIHMAGGSITPRLVQRILNDTGEDPDRLPVMQHALMRTWVHWSRREHSGLSVDIEDYEAAGTLENALSNDADEAYFEACATVPESGREIVKCIFQRLRERDPSGREIRRPTSLRELCAVAEEPAEKVLAVLACFRSESRSFLMPPFSLPLPEDREIDITHESLLRQWKRLQGPASEDKGWLTEEEDSRRTLLRLVDRAEQQVQGNPDYLRGPLLQLALNWWNKRRPNEAWAERYTRGFQKAKQFLCESQAESERELEREAKRLDEQEAARVQQARREEELKAKRLKMRLVYFFAALVAIGSVLAAFGSVYAMKQRQLAMGESERAEKAKGRLIDYQRQERYRLQAKLSELRTNEAKENARIAEKNETIARNLQKQASVQLLASKAALIGTGNAAMLPVSMLLAAESMRRQPSIDSEAVLSEGLPLLPKPLSQLSNFSSIEKAAFSANGLLLTSEPGLVRVWDLVTRRVRRSFEIAGNPAAIAIDKDADSIAVAFNETKQGIIQVFDLRTGEQIAHRVTDSGIRYVHLGRNGFLLTVIGNALRYWNDISDEKGYQPGPGDDFSNWESSALSSSSDAMLLALFHPERSTIDVYDLPSRNPVLSWSLDDPALDIAFDPVDKSRFASLSKNGTIKLWNLKFRAKTAQLNSSLQFGSTAGPAFTDAEIGFSNDGRFLSVNEFTGLVRTWDTKAGGREVARVFPSKGSGTAVVEGIHRFIVLAQKGASQVWQMTFVPLLSQITCASISRDGTLSTLRALSGENFLWNPDTSSWLKADFAPIIRTLALNTDRHLAAGTSRDGRTLYAVRFDTDRREVTASFHDPEISRLRTLAFSKGGRFLGGNIYSSTRKGIEYGVIIWDTTKPNAKPAKITIPDTTVTLLDFTPDFDHRCILRKSIREKPDGMALWNLQLGEYTELPRAFQGNVSSLAFSPDGKLLATTILGQSGEQANTEKVWRWPENKAFGKAFEIDTSVNLVSFSADSHYLATSGGQGFVRIWNIATGKEEGRVASLPLTMSFVDGDRRILTFDSEYVVKSPWRPGDLLKETCERIGRSLYSDEWKKYLGSEKPYRTCQAFANFQN